MRINHCENIRVNSARFTSGLFSEKQTRANNINARAIKASKSLGLSPIMYIAVCKRAEHHISSSLPFDAWCVFQTAKNSRTFTRNGCGTTIKRYNETLSCVLMCTFSIRHVRVSASRDFARDEERDRTFDVTAIAGDATYHRTSRQLRIHDKSSADALILFRRLRTRNTFYISVRENFSE